MQRARKLYDHTQNCAQGKHIAAIGCRCKHCHIELCQHHRANLAGCQRPRGHNGLHGNNWGTPISWPNEEGLYIKNQQDWSALIDMAIARSSTRH